MTLMGQLSTYCFGISLNISIRNFDYLFFWFIWGFTSLSTLYRSYRDGRLKVGPSRLADNG